MARLLGATLRLLVLALAGLTVVAVVVNRLVPLETSRAIPLENLPISVNQFACGAPDADSTFLVPSSGRLLEFKLDQADRLDHATFVSWRGQADERLVFGRWRHLGDWSNPVSQVGIACLAYPSGKVLASRETATLPLGPACNLPGLNGRLLFTTSDGRLHTSQIKEGRRALALSEPQPIGWKLQSPSVDQVLVMDPSRPSTLPGTSRIVLVSLHHKSSRTPGKRAPFNPPAIWWLAFDQDWKAVVAAGRITPVDPTGKRTERYPAAVVDKAGKVLLAYLSRDEFETQWKVNVMPLSFQTGNKSNPTLLVAGKPAVVATTSCATAPVWSPEGRTLTYMKGERGSPHLPVRAAISPEPDQPDSPRLVLREPLTPYRTLAWNVTAPVSPGGTTPMSHLSSVEPASFSLAVNTAPFGPWALPLTYSRRGSKLSITDTEVTGMFPMFR